MFGLVPWRKERHTEGLSRPRDDGPFALMRRELDSLFDRVFGNWAAGTEGWGLDLEDTGKEVVVRAEAPGFEATDFDVQVSGDVLHIRAEHKQEEKGKEDGGGTSRYGRLERWVTLPAGTDRDKVEARYRNGVLEVRLPKTADALGRRIEVKT
jgi:HSP20 family protein